MPDDIFEVNTPDTLGVTPRYVLQHNAISRSAHNFSATAKKLTAMAMALLPPDLSSLSAAFTFADFCKALDYTKSGKSFEIFKAAVQECMENVVRIETPPDKKGKTSWLLHHWFQVARFNKDSGICTMTFDRELADFLKELKTLYAKINLDSLGRLQSRYALRIYEVAISYSSLQGKNGNETRAWYFERSIPELRRIFGIGPDEYQDNWLFRRKVIDGPVQEINGAGVGVEIKTEGIKKGRNLEGFRFDCKNVAGKTAGKKQGGRKAASLPEPDGNAAQNREDKELEHLKELYPDEFAELYAAKLAEMPFFGEGAGNGFKRAAALRSALELLRDKHGIRK